MVISILMIIKKKEKIMTLNDILVTFAGYGLIISIIYMIRSIFVIFVNIILIIVENEKALPFSNIFTRKELIIIWLCLSYIITYILY